VIREAAKYLIFPSDKIYVTPRITFVCYMTMLHIPGQRNPQLHCFEKL